MHLQSLAILVAMAALCVSGCSAAHQAEPAKAPPVQTRKTIGKTTQKVLELGQALADGGVLAEMGIAGSGIDAGADAYRVNMGKASVMAVEQKMKLYQAEHGKLPATHDEFMRLIIEPGGPNGLQLPMLPYYQEYAYDPERKALVVVEFPAKKAQRQQETTGASGL